MKRKFLIAIIFLFLLGGISMVDLIQSADTLAQGKNKINAAIGQSNQAINTANNSADIANQAKSTADQTRTEFSQITNNDTSALGGQLSVGSDGTAYSDAQSRFIDEYNKIDTKLNTIEENKADKSQLTDLSSTLESLVPKRHIFGGQLAKLKESLCNPLEQMTGIVFIGDSITWGRTLTGNGETEPRDGTLSDPRDVFATPSFVNEFKRYIGEVYANNAAPVLTNWDASPSGESIAEYTVQNILYPKDGDFTLSTTGTSATVTEVSTSASITGRQLRLAAASAGTGVHTISFNFTGNQFILSFASTVSNNLSYELFVDGVSKGTFTTTPGTDGIVAGNNNQRTHTFNYVRNKEIKIVTKQSGETGTNTLRLEGIIINKKIRISNQGINGSAARVYKLYNLTGNTFGDGEAIETEDNYVFIQLGTNDRLAITDVPKGTNTFKINLDSVIDAVTPSANVILMCANPVTNESTSTYSFNMQGVRNTVYQLAKVNNLDMVDNYAIFNGVDLSTVLADGLHPNEIGHDIIARNIINSMEY